MTSYNCRKALMASVGANKTTARSNNSIVNFDNRSAHVR